ncbi:MAG: ATP-binding protein [Oligoflexia bacterium]|nr:ATP-binding protein [Oligoflexia bacterium]
MKDLSRLLRGETLEIEYKRDDGSFSDTNLYESIVGLTNANGGSLLVGVENSGKVVGSVRAKTESWKTPEAVQGKIMANTVPACATHVAFVDYNGMMVALISVPKAATTTGTRSGKFLKRTIDGKGKPQNLPMTADEIIGSVARVGIQDFSSTVLSDAGIDELDLELAEDTRKRRLAQITDPELKELLNHNIKDLLRSENLLRGREDRPTIAALLLFGKRNSLQLRLPNHRIDYQVFGGRGEILRNETLDGPIAEIFPKVLNFPELLRNSDQFTYRGSNVVIPEYPEDSRREAFANAIVHRDYTLQSSVQVQLFDGELFVVNPGGFPQGVTLSNLLSVAPTPRNRALAEGMKTFGFVERSGRGVDFIFQGQARYGRPAPDYSASSSDSVNVRLTGGKANLEFCRFILAARDEATIPELLLLNAMFFRRHITPVEATQVIQRPLSMVQEILSKLLDDKLVDVIPGRPPKYHLKGSSSIRARKAVKPARLTKPQLVLFTDRIMAELTQRSPNALSDIADTVGLSPSQTRRLLYRLKALGQVDLTAGKRWALAGNSNKDL